jgi:uncharacterized protein YgiM (DUF1202 family)
MTTTSRTYLDRLKKSVKNNRFLVILFAASFVLATVATSLDAFTRIRDFFSNKKTIPAETTADGRSPKEIIANTQPTIKNALVKDADGYLNIRQLPTKNSAIIGIVNNGERIDIYTSSGDWLLIKYKNELIGYAHKSRIQL